MARAGRRRDPSESANAAPRPAVGTIDPGGADRAASHRVAHLALGPSLKGRNILDGLEYTAEELLYLLDLAASLKRAKREGTEEQHLRTKEICAIFERAPTRKRCMFDVAAFDQGAHITYLDLESTRMGREESVKDIARILGRLYDGIEYPGVDQATVVTLAEHAAVPVWNGLTAEFHPTQILADILTMREHSDKPIGRIACGFLGNVANATGTTLLIGGAQLGMDVRLVGPRELWPPDGLIEDARAIATETGARITLTDSLADGIAGADYLYTDAWASTLEPKEVWTERIPLLRPYQVTEATIAATANPATKFMHRLPAFHNTETYVGAEFATVFGMTAMEVTDEVFESPASIVFDQAENRMHTIKAILVATIGD